MIQRDLYLNICNHLDANIVLLIFGARRVGKSYLIKAIISDYQKPYLLLNGEDLDDAERLGSRRKSMYDPWVKGLSLLIIDEAHAVENIGVILKLLIDSYPQLTIIATGSSAFDLNRSSGEPLVGRRIVFRMFPLSENELIQDMSPVETEKHLPTRLVYGSYPDVYLNELAANREMYLRDLVSTYLLKDILAYENIKHSNKLVALLKLIAYQIGSEVSYDELAKSLRIDRNTVEKYLDLLSKVFVIFRLGGYSGNLRKEVSKSSKWYFYDVGLRNAIIGDFTNWELRRDKGQLWENFFISERMKFNSNSNSVKEYYFWRTYDQQEIDLLELSGTTMEAFETKLAHKENYRFPIAFRKTYPEAINNLITLINYQSYL